MAEVWAWHTGLFAPVMGDADRQPDGTRLADQGLGDRAARIVELDPTTSTVRWELRITADRADRTNGFSAPRAERVGAPTDAGP